MSKLQNSQAKKNRAAAASNGRHARIGLLALMVLAALFAGGALTLKFKLETVRRAVEQKVESKTSTRFKVGSIDVVGLRGLSVTALEIAFETPTGVAVRLRAPKAIVYVDLVELFHGILSVNSVQLDGATLQLERGPEGKWFLPEEAPLPELARLLSIPDLRLTGKGCTLEIINVVGDTRLVLDDVSFDVSQLRDSKRVLADVAGNLGGSADKYLKVGIDFTSFEDFDLRAECSQIAAEDVNVFLPAPTRLVISGQGTPSLRVTGFPNTNLVVWLTMPYHDVVIREQPEYIGPASGVLTALANYDGASEVLTISTAQAVSDHVGGTLMGTVDFASEHPRLDLRLATDSLPISDVVNYAMRDWPRRYGEIDLTLAAPSEVAVSLTGTTDAPVVSSVLSADAGHLEFTPSDKTLPQASLELRGLRVHWNSGSRSPTIACNISGGTVSHKGSAIRAEDVSGVLSLEKEQLTLKQLSAKITGNPLNGSLSYDLASDQGELEFSGTLAQVEKTILGDLIPSSQISGALGIKATVSKQGPRYVFSASLDATQAQFDHLWWLRKPVGIGATLELKKTVYEPGKDLTLGFTVDVASSHIDGLFALAFEDGQLALETVEYSTDHVEVADIDTCLRVPYRLAGGVLTNGSYKWTPHEDGPRIVMTCELDELVMTAEGKTVPMHVKGAKLGVEMVNGDPRTGHLTLAVEDAVMPPIGEPWFVPLRSDPVLLKKFPPIERHWTHDLASRQVDMPPWKGRDLVASAYVNSKASGFHSYRALIDGGSLEGDYHLDRIENAFKTGIRWEHVPVGYFLKHLDYSNILTGDISGTLTYARDRDDPSTLRGHSTFEVRDGLFSAEFLFARFQEHMESEMETIPPSLRFSTVGSDVELEGDVVRTRDFQLISDGIKLKGQGEFVPDGDIDYNLQVRISPEIAARIPALKNNLNIDGHLLAQQDIALAFKLTGLTVNPTGDLAERPPVSDTLMTGAFAVTKEVVSGIATPGKILVDLLKIAGGIVGPKGRSPGGNKGVDGH